MAEAAASGAQPGSHVEPYRSYNFQVEIRGVVEGHFHYCSEIDVQVEPIVHREGGKGQIVRLLPGRVSYGQITLRSGVSASADLFNWMMSIAKGKIDRRTVTICVLDTDSVTEKMRWQLSEAWPCGWKVKPLDALGRDIYVEELTFVHEGIDRS